MKLAEALNLRADIAKRLSQLSERLAANAKVQEGDSPAEDPSELLEELDRLTKQLEDLISRINLTNSKTLSDAKTLSAMIAAKDTL
ncbi:MAG: DIP1984 family protein, partial [Oscillospiraceae bacterium]|nr:DIP1984 family protein [Oscillospiraceae bacterium]